MRVRKGEGEVTRREDEVMWTDDLSEEIDAMFSSLVVYIPQESGMSFFRPENPADVVERMRAWRKRNLARSRAYDAARYAENRESRKAQARDAYAARKAAQVARARLA